MKLHYKDREIIFKLLHTRSKSHIAKRYGCTLATVTNYCKWYLRDMAPPGKCKPYKGHLVYDDGRIWNTFGMCWKKHTVRGGYHETTIGRKVWKISRLVLTVFDRPAKKGEVARHYRDPDRSNNNLDNLRWGTPKQNNKDTARHGNQRRLGAKRRLNEKHVRILRKRYYAGEVSIVNRYSKRYGVSRVLIYMAIKRQTWKNVK